MLGLELENPETQMNRLDVRLNHIQTNGLNWINVTA